MSERVFPLPGPFKIHRIVEMEGAFLQPGTLFPDATPEAVKATETARNPKLYDPASDRLVMAFQVFVVQTPRSTILIDGSVGNNKERPRNPPWHRLNGPFLDDLATLGLSPDDIDIVICTHLHADHVGWNTRLENGSWVPTFPKARYVFVQSEATYWRQVLAENPPDMVNHGSWGDSVEPIFQANLAVEVPDDYEVEEGVRLVGAPGHTPGNAVVRLEQDGERAYVTGDVIHHPIQVEQPRWSSCFCSDPEQASETRVAMLDTIAEEGAWLLPAHFPTPTAAKIRRGDAGFQMVQSL